MKVTNEIGLLQFEAWSGAKDTKETIIEHNKVEEFDNLIEELYSEGIGATQLNDLLWFEDEWLFEQLGIDIEDEE